jgi:hypothetical protein
MTYTNPRHEAAAAPLTRLQLAAWVAADSTATEQEIADALAPLGIMLDRTPDATR